VIERVVFDTSTLVSAVIRPDSIPWQACGGLFSAARSCASARRWLKWKRSWSGRSLIGIGPPDAPRGGRTDPANCRMFVMDPVDASPPCRDPRDNKFLALALIADADAIISSDNDLLTCIPGGAFRF